MTVMVETGSRGGGVDGWAIANSPIERRECNETTGSDNSEWVSYSTVLIWSLTASIESHKGPQHEHAAVTHSADSH